MSTQVFSLPGGQPTMFAAASISQWFAVATVAKHEKAIARHFQLRSIEHFLPLYSAVRRWKDRRVTLQLPLFAGYIFVRIPAVAKGVVERVPGVLRIVGFNGALVAVAEEEIERMRKAVALWNAEPCAYLSRGKRVRVCSGAFAGVEGIVAQHKGRLRIVISVDSIMRSFNIEIDAASVQLEPLKCSKGKEGKS